MKLYKYLAPGRLQVLRGCMIRYTQPGALNDPFEVRPHVAAIASRDDAIQMLLQMLPEESRRMHGLLSADRQAALSVGAIENLVKADLSESDSEIINRINGFAPFVQDLLRPKLDGLLGMLCLSEVSDSLLMWSHYGNEHCGFVIGFDADHPYFDDRRGPQDELRHLRRVNYRQDRPSGQLSEFDGADILLVKSTHWSYEQEWRIMRALREAKETIPADPYPISLFPFPPEAVVEVILGARMEHGTRRETLDLLTQDERWKHVHVLQAIPDEQRFQLRFQTLSPGRGGSCEGAPR